MLARARLKLKNAESSISFIQEQHTKTLEGLHQEIQQLQQKNARLTFELALQGSSKTGTLEVCKHENEIKVYKTEVNTLQTALTTCKEEIKFLKHKLMNVESNLTEEVAERDAQIGRLSVEVDRRALIIVHLTKQLHQMRSEYAQLTERVLHMQNALSSETGILQKMADPPATAVGRIRRRSRRATSSALPQDSDHNDHHRVRMIQRRSLPTPQTHPSTPTLSPRPPSSSPPPHLRERVNRRAGQVVATSPASSSPPSQRSSTTNLDPSVHLPPDTSKITKNTSTTSTPNLPQSEGPPLLPPIPPNPSLLAPQRNPKSSSSARLTRLQQDGDKREKRRLLVKEELTHGKGQAWQELHQSGSD